MESKPFLASDSTVPEADIRPGADEFVPQHIEILTGDAGEGGLLRIRQFAARADAKNLNRRIYPRAVIQAAIDEARSMAKAGAMLCEMRHPEVANTKDGQKYVHNPDRVTARVDRISDVQHDGRVFIDRTILDTPMGRIVADAIRAKKPIGISTRFRMKGHPATVGGDSVDVATWMEIHTWDDVENPAVVGAGEPVPLSDAVLETLSLPPAAEDAAPTPEPEPQPIMNLTAFRAAFAALIVASADAVQVTAARTRYHAAFLESDAKEKSEERAHAVTLELDAIRAGYKFEVIAPPSIAASLPRVDAEKKETAAADSVPSLSAEDAQRVKEVLARDAAERDREAVKAAVDSLAEKDPFKGLDEQTRAHVLSRTAARALKADAVEAIAMDELESAMKLVSEANLKAAGYVKADGRTVVTVTREARPWMEGVERILAASDDYGRTAINGENPSDPTVLARRKRNRELLEPVLERIATVRHGADSLESWFLGSDAHARGGLTALGDSLRAVSDATSLSNVYNQPTILTAFLIQSFQDMRFLDFVQSFGPGKGGNGGWAEAADGIGSVLRLPVEYWSDPANYGTIDGTYDAGLLVPEGVGIDEGSVNVTWLSYAPDWMRIAASITRDATRAMANGPADYGLIGRTLYHMAARKGRSTDKYIADEMLNVSDEYGAVAVAGEAYTNGNGTTSLNLANNSVYNAGGSISVNLSTSKTAAAAIVSGTDPSVTYGANVVGALRLRTRGAASSLYAGTSWGTDPIVQPRTKVDLTSQGAKTSSTKNAFSLTAPANMIRGYLGGDGQVRSIPGVAGTPTYAVDFENGVVVFTAAAGLAGSGGAITTAVTASYTYATNFDNFQVNNLSLSNITVENYLNGLLGRFDLSAAIMGSGPRFMPPSLAIMSLSAATWIKRATIFYQLNSPKDTELFPSPDYFFSRNGIMGANHNTPWTGGDRRILLTRQGATKYGIDTPLEVAGPFPKYDSNARLVATDAFYAQENRVICTPQVEDQAGNILNPVNRTIILR